MTGTMKNKPAKCCCCPCWDDKNLSNWAVVAEDWTGTTTRATSDADAVIASDRRATFQVLTAACGLTSHQTGDAVRFGFRNTAGDAVYVEAVVQTNTAYVTWTAYNHPVGESRTVLWNGPTVYGVLGIRLLYDENYEDFYYGGTGNRFTVFQTYGTTGSEQYGVCQKLTTDLTLDTAFVGTGTLDAGTTATFRLDSHYNCMCRYCTGVGATGSSGGVHLGPSEFELTIAGVTGSDADYVNVASVDVYEPRNTLFQGIFFPFAGGNNPAWNCYWGWRNPNQNGFNQYANSVDVSYSEASDQTTVNVWTSGRTTFGGPPFTAMAKWQHVYSGRIDARSIDLQMDSDDEILGNSEFAAATVTLRASP